MPHRKEKGKDWKWRTKMRTRTTRNWNRNDFYRIIKHSVANMLHRWMQNRRQRCSRKHGLCLKGTPATYIFAEETYGWAYNGNQKKHPRKQEPSQSWSRGSTSGAASGGQRGLQSARCPRPGRALRRKRAGRLRHGPQRRGQDGDVPPNRQRNSLRLTRDTPTENLLALVEKVPQKTNRTRQT